MKKIGIAIITLAGLVSCGAPNGNTTQAASASGAVTTAVATAMEEEDHSKLFTQAYAEKILGEPAGMTESKDGGDIYNSTFTANKKDEKSGKTGNIYFMYEQHPTADAAHTVYTDILKANEKNGARAIEGMGDEAYFHTDSTNFLFIMARKGNRMIRMKVNKTTSHTSETGFREVAKDVVAAL